MRKLSLIAALMTAALATPALACNGHDEKQAAKPYGHVDLATFAAHVEKKTAAIYDVTSAARSAKGHVPGAQHVSVSDDGKLSGAALPADKAATVAFYCGSERCDASDEAAEVAVGQGYASVVVYKGGIAGWEKAGKPVEVPAAKPAAATPAVNTPAAKPAKGEG